MSGQGSTLVACAYEQGAIVARCQGEDDDMLSTLRHRLQYID